MTVLTQEDLTGKATVNTFTAKEESFYELDALLIVAHGAVPAHLMRPKDRFDYCTLFNQIGHTIKSSSANVRKQIQSPIHLQTNT